MKPTLERIAESVKAMASVIAFFPKDELAQRIVTASIASFVNTEAELDWLTIAACGSMRDFERGGGLPELRGLFCTRFKPADGFYQHTTTPGYRAEDLEQQFLRRELEADSRRLEEYQRRAFAAPAADREPFPVPEARRIVSGEPAESKVDRAIRTHRRAAKGLKGVSAATTIVH